MDKLKLYCYADETGPDTKGKMFLVAVVITTSELRETIERNLEDLELKSGKGILKWRLTSIPKKKSYLLGILGISALQGSLFYSVYRDTLDYFKQIAKTLAKAIIAFSQNRDYQATIYIDGLRKTEIEQVVKFLSAESINRRKVKGLRDESSAYIRLADALAGFFRDYEEGKSYAWRTNRDYTEEQIELLIIDEIDKERRKFERLKKIHLNHEEIVKERRERIPEEVRRSVWFRDEGKCVRCGSDKDLEFDHIIPVSKGGSNTEKNVQLLCKECNRKKSDKI